MEDNTEYLTVGELVDKLKDIPADTIVTIDVDDYNVPAYGVGCGKNRGDKATVAIF